VCEEDCCPDGCGIEDVFETSVNVHPNFGAGTYYVLVGEETAVVEVENC
jgi:hypothetical protein